MPYSAERVFCLPTCLVLLWAGHSNQRDVRREQALVVPSLVSPLSWEAGEERDGVGGLGEWVDWGVLLSVSSTVPIVAGLCDLRGCVRVLLPGGVGAP